LHGLNAYYGGFSYYPIKMLARLVASPTVFIARPVTEGAYAPWFSYPFGGSQLQIFGLFDKLAPHFPYGYNVEPDRP